jgi:dTDP-4-amino-4,6-dideoxygalactose transaminase
MDFPEAHFVSERIVSLPLFPDMTEGDRGDVVEAVLDIGRKFGR